VSDGLFWTGSLATGWGARTALSSTFPVGDANWTSTALLPTGANLLDGAYQLTATAVDGTGNATDAVAAITVDQTAPASVAFKTPTGTTVSSLSSASGTAVESAGGSGIVRVDLTIQRASDGKYWTGAPATGWGAKTALSTTLAPPAGGATVTWTRTNSATTPMPTGANLSAGRYALTATAHDKAGNSRSTTLSIRVNP
jgi:Bacterial Ig-like domain